MPIWGIWAAIRAFGFWRVARDGLGAAWRWITASPSRLWAALAILLAATALFQHRQAQHWAQTARATQAGWDAARAQAEATRRAAEQRYRSLADEADHNHAALVAQGNARLAAYIASHRMQPAPQTDPARPAQGGDPGLPANPAPGPIVAPIAISEADLRTCDADYAYARAAYDWAQELRHGS